MDGNRPAVVGVLHRLLADPASVRWASGSVDNALRLAALNCRLAGCLLADLGVAAELPRAHRLRTRIQPGPVRVTPSALIWPPSRPDHIRPLPATRELLETVSGDLAHAVLRWAPPVVVPTARGEYRVVANHLSALLARQKSGVGDVRVRCLAGSTSLTRTLPEACQTIATVLSPLCDRQRDRILRLARDEVEGWIFAGLRRAQYFRVTAQRR